MQESDAGIYRGQNEAGKDDLDGELWPGHEHSNQGISGAIESLCRLGGSRCWSFYGLHRTISGLYLGKRIA